MGREIPRVDNQLETVRLKKETNRKKSVPFDTVEKTLPVLSKIVTSMVRLKMVTGMRSTETGEKLP